MSDKELGLLLINAGYVSQDDILSSLQQYSTGVVRRLFSWMEGFFRFEPDSLPPSDRISVRIDLENLIIEGSRQMREWEQLQEEIPSLDMALKFTDRPGTNLRNINLSVEEWRVVSYVNPKNSIRQIARTTKMNDHEIRRVIYGLLQAGLVEIIRPGGTTLPNRMFPTKNKAEQKSLVTRLIDRIRSLETHRKDFFMMQTVKIVVTGPFSSGKTEFIRSVSEIDVVSTERKISTDAEKIKETTTVAMDFGRITVDEDLVLYLFGTPGQRRFDFMWEILSEGMLGFIVMVDSTRPETFREARSILETFRAYAPTPYVVAANKQDRPDAWDVDDMRVALRIDPKIKILPCVARKKESVKSVLLELLYGILAEMEQDGS